MALVENQDGGYDNYPESPEVSSTIQNLQNRGYTTEQILKTVSGLPINNSVAAQIRSQLQSESVPPTSPAPISDNKQNFILNKLSDKQKDVAYMAARKRAESNNNIPTSAEDLKTLFPNVTEEDLKQYHTAVSRKDNLKGVPDTSNPYTLKEVLGDATNSLMQGAVGLSEILYGGAEMAFMASQLKDNPLNYSRLESIESLTDTEISPFFQYARDYWDDLLQSDNSSEAEARIQQSQQAYSKKIDAETAANIKNGNNEYWEYAKGISKKAANTVQAYLDNPGQIVEEALEEIPQMLLGGITAKQGIKLLTAGMGKEEAKAYLKSEAGKKAQERVATAAGVGAAAMSEASSNAVETKAEILEMSEKELIEGSPYYNELRAQNLTHEEARMRVSDRAFSIVAALTLPTAALASKITGAGQLEGSLFLKGSAVANTVTKGVTSVGSEALEEAIQGGTGQLAQNIATRETADSSQELTENVGEAIGQGTVVGGATSGAVMASVSLPEMAGSFGEDTKKVAEKIDKVLKATAKNIAKVSQAPEVKQAIETGDITPLVDTTSDDYKPEQAVTALLDPAFIPIRDDANNESEEDFNVRVDSYIEQVDEHYDNLLEKISSISEKDPKLAQPLIVQAREFSERFDGIINNLRPEEVESTVDAVIEGDETAKGQILGSISRGLTSNVSTEQAEKLLDSPNLTPVERSQVESFIALRAAVGVLNRGGPSSEVSRELLNGSRGAVGLNDYSKMLNSAVRTNDIESARNVLRQLKAFTKRQVDRKNAVQAAFNEVSATKDYDGITLPEYDMRIHPGSYDLVLAVIGDTNAVVNTYNKLMNLGVTAFSEGVTTKSDTVDIPSDELVQEEPAQETPENTQYVNHSGGAAGSDTAWGQAGERFGVTSNHYYRGNKTPTGNVEITDAQFVEGDVMAKQVARQWGINPASKQNTRNLLARNFQQVAQSDAVFAITEGFEKAPSGMIRVKGGTGYAVQMAVNQGKPVYVFNQKSGNWFTWNGKKFEQTESPTLTPNFAGIGTRGLNARGQQAIDEVYANTFGTQEQSSEVVDEQEPKASTEETVEGTTTETQKTNEDDTGSTGEGAETETVDDLETRINEVMNASKLPNKAKIMNEALGLMSEDTDEQAESREALNQYTSEAELEFIETIEKEIVNFNAEQVGSFNEITEALTAPELLQGEIAAWVKQGNKESPFLDYRSVYEAIETLAPGVSAKTVTMLQELQDGIMAGIDTVIGIKPPVAAKKNPIQLLLKQGVENYTEGLPEAVKEAMAISAAEWVTTRGEDTIVRSIEDIARLTGAEEDLIANHAAMYEYYIDKGVPTELVIDNLGKPVVRALNLKLKDDAPANFLDLLAHSIGSAIMLGMAERGLVKIDQSKGMYSATGQFDPKNTFRHVKLLKNDKTMRLLKAEKQIELVNTALNMRDSNFKNPSFEPPENTPETINRGSQVLSKKQKAAVAASNADAYMFDEDMVGIFNELGPEVMMKIMGHDANVTVDEQGNISANGVHITRAAGIAGRNQQIESSISNFIDFLAHAENEGAGMGQEFFFEHVVDSNNRIRKSNVKINTQTDKLHRFLIKMKGWDYTVDDTNSRMAFKLALGQALDVKIDKLTAKEAIRQVDEILQGKGRKGIYFVDAVDALQRIQSGRSKQEGTFDEDTAAVLRAVNLFGERAHTLAGLVAATKYSETEPFNSTLPIEIDGLTNGTALALLQFAPNGDKKLYKLLAKVGIFNSHVFSFGRAKELGLITKDNYETLAGSLTSVVQGMLKGEIDLYPKRLKKFQNFDMKAMRPIGNLLSKKYDVLSGATDDVSKVKSARELLDLFGLNRNVGKNPVMIGNYGAGNNKISYEFAYEVVGNMYLSLEDAVARNDEAALELIKQDIEDVLGYSVNFGMTNALTWKLSPQDEIEFVDRIVRSFGAAMKLALSKEFGDLQYVRSKFNQIVGATNALYRAAWDTEYQKIIKEKGYLSVKDKRRLENKLKKYRPEIDHLATSSEESNNTHISLLSIDKEESRSNEHGIEMPIKNKGNVGNFLTSNFTSFVEGYVYSEVGARATVNAIQSTDSAIMVENLLEDYPSLNIYDAVIVKPTDAIRAARTLNEATIRLNKNKSVYGKAVNHLIRARKKYPQEYKKLANQYLTEELNPFNISDFSVGDELVSALELRKTIDANRKEMFKNIYYTTQYNFEDGGYVTNIKEESLDSLFKEFWDSTGENLTLGSSPTGASRNAQATEHDVDSQNVLSLMAMLRSNSQIKSSESHAGWLNQLLGDTFNTVIEPLKMIVGHSTDETAGYYSPSDREVVINVNSSTPKYESEMAPDEVFAHEIIHSIVKNALEANNQYAREIRVLWANAKKYIKPEDFLTSSTDSLAEAKRRYDYIFDNPNKIGKFSVGLHEFVAYGLTNEKLRNLLLTKVPASPETDTSPSLSLFDRIRNLYNKFLKLFSDRIRNVTDVSADARLVDLVKQAVKHQENARQIAYQNSVSRKMEEGIKKGLIDYIQRPLLNLLESERVTKKSSNRVVRGVQNLAGASRIMVAGDFGKFRKILNQVATRLGATENNIFVALLNEIQGRTEDNNRFYAQARESRKLLDQARAEIAANIKKHLRNQFVTTPTEDEEIALTKLLLKTDLVAILDKYSVEQLHSLLTNRSALNQAIKDTQKELKQFGTDSTFYIRMAQSLGYSMITGQFTEQFGLKNATSISQLVGTGKAVPAHADQAVPVIDRLASLRALAVLQDTEAKTITTALEVINREFQADAENNGITFTMYHHNDYKQRSLEKLFNNNPMLMEKGYIREIYNPNKSFVVAPASDEALLAKDGYVRKGRVSKDVDDPLKDPMIMYMSDMGTLAPWQAGTVSLADMNARGTPYFQTVVNSKDSDPLTVSGANLTNIKASKQVRARDIYNGLGSPKPTNGLVPLLDEAGNIVSFRYIMKEETKKLLDQNLRLTDVMGAMEGNMKSKISGKEINSNTVKALVEDYRSNFNNEPERYVLVGLNSQREDLQELYRMLPQEMRDEIKAATGQHGIFVKQELVKLIFGQRKFSVAHYFREKLRMKELNSQASNMYLTHLYRVLGSPRAAKVEQVWQELIAYVKDTIVIKSFTTLLGNITSNNLLLWSLGVPYKDILADQERAMRYADQHHKDSSRIEEIDRELGVERQKAQTPTRLKKIKQLMVEKTKLEDEIAVNPVTALIEAGVYQSIIEDVDMLEDEFSYKSRIEDWASPYLDKVPESAKTVGGYALLTRSNKLYQGLRKMTQMSDFAARFALHEHNLAKGMTSEASVNMIVDTFIDYDLPTHTSIEYLNSVGGVFFTKFFLRIQKVIFNVLKNNPARIIGLDLLQEIFGNLSDITDSFALFKDIGFMFKDPVEALGGWWDTFPWVQMIK